jgi:hypothetical protein
MLRRVAVVAAVTGALLLAAIPASAGPAEDAVGVLRTDSLYIDPTSGRVLDADAVRAAIGGEPIKIAILPVGPSVDQIRVLPRQMARDLPGNTIAVVAGRYFYAGSEVTCSGAAGRAASNAINANEEQLDAEQNSDITKALMDFVAEIRSAPRCPAELGRGDRYADEPGGGEASAGVDDTAAVLPWLVGGIALAVIGVGGWVGIARQRTRGGAGRRRDEAAALVARLGTELEAFFPDEEEKDGPDARMDAAAKHGEAEAILVGATTDEQFAAARHAALEGLIAARAARVAHGMDPGAPVPSFDPPVAGHSVTPGDQLNRPASEYVPGVSYFHVGDAAVARGWYPEPFWQERAEPVDDRPMTTTEPAD